MAVRDGVRLTTEEMVEELWYELRGTNGEGALSRLNNRLDGIETSLSPESRMKTCPFNKIGRNRMRYIHAFAPYVAAGAALAATFLK